jgi:F-type H+-transporting ATPase subunit delta
MEKRIAGKFYKLFKTRDTGLAFLESFDLLKNADIDKVVSYYKELSDGTLKLAEVTTSSVLSEKQQKAVEEKIFKLFGKNIIVIFEIDGELLGGLVVKVGDDVLDESMRSKIASIKL